MSLMAHSVIRGVSAIWSLNASVVNDLRKRTSSLDVAVVGEAIIEGPVLPDGAFHLRVHCVIHQKSKRSARRGEESP